jgi:hypothetical protein
VFEPEMKGIHVQTLPGRGLSSVSLGVEPCNNLHIRPATTSSAETANGVTMANIRSSVSIGFSRYAATSQVAQSIRATLIPGTMRAVRFIVLCEQHSYHRGIEGDIPLLIVSAW